LKKHIDLHILNEARFLKFIQDIFVQRRKTLTNNLSAAYNIPKENIIRFLNRLGFDERIRSEALSLSEISDIYKTMFEAPK
jgi:16S rRNA A1518/A1519 N6-dimethyltransferase RsmA/KsgA/DIM1 with predicted DNA glycosylase/AP lyase activity